MPLSDTSESKCNFIVLCSGPDIFRAAFRQPKYKSSRSFLPINVKTNLSSDIRLKKQICIISIFSFRVLELFQSNARKPNLLSHLTSVFVVHLSVLVASDLWDDCNRKKHSFSFFPFFTMTQHPSPLRDMTTIHREQVQSFNISSVSPTNTFVI